jgi:hypothetical protein
MSKGCAGRLLCLGAFWALALEGVALSGCGPRVQIVPVANHDLAGLNAHDIVQVMRRAGFSDKQILEEGTDLRNALSSSGAATVRLDKKVEAIFAVDGDYVHVTSRQRGSFTYDLKGQEFR